MGTERPMAVYDSSLVKKEMFLYLVTHKTIEAEGHNNEVYL